MFFMYYLIGIPIGWALFKALNKHFDVYYFGIKGVIGTISGCWTVGALIVGIAFALLKTFAIPAIIIVVILMLVGRKKSEE